MSKSLMLTELYEKYKIKYKDREIVTGDGNEDSKILLVGEAPGREEIKLSKPFVGAAGQNLEEFMEILGNARSSIFITNSIKYRLSKVNPKSGRIVNRPATWDEIIESRPFLLDEIKIIKPEFIVTLGNVAIKAVTGERNISIGNVHGQLNEIKIVDITCKLFPLYHPASIIYNRKLKEAYLEDLYKLKKYLH